MDRAICLSTNTSAEPSGYGISTGTSATCISEGLINQPTNLGQQVGGRQAMAIPMFPRDRAP